MRGFSQRREIQPDIGRGCALRKAPHRNIGYAGGRDRADGLESDAARSFGSGAARDQCHCLAQGRRTHIVEQYVARARRQCGFDLVEPVNFANDVLSPRFRPCRVRALHAG